MDDLDLIADLNAQDDDCLSWSTLTDAVASERVRPGVMLLAGNSQAQAVVRVVAVDDDGRSTATLSAATCSSALFGVTGGTDSPPTRPRTADWGVPAEAPSPMWSGLALASWTTV